MTKYRYYIWNKERNTPAIDSSMYANLELKVVKPVLNNMHNILWSILSFFSFKPNGLKEYQFVYNGSVIASAQVMHKILTFRFMDKDGIHIGPCYTSPEHRGKGLYPLLLKQIIKDFEGRYIYIFSSVNNTSSIKGIEKVGFTPFAIGYQTQFKCYVIEKYI